MMLVPEAEREYGLNADHWREVFAAEGFASPTYKYGIRRPYTPAHGMGVLGYRLHRDSYPNADAIAARGLMVHVGHLRDVRTPDWFRETIARSVSNVDGLRRRFGLA